MLTWTRRAFLQTILAGTAGACLVRVLPTPDVPCVVPAALGPRTPTLLYEFIAAPRVPSNAALLLNLTRNGQSVISMHGSSMYRWVATPGDEIVLDGLRNESDADFQISMFIMRDGQRFAVQPDGTEVSMGKAWIGRVPDVHGSGSFTTYVERERAFVERREAA